MSRGDFSHQARSNRQGLWRAREMKKLQQENEALRKELAILTRKISHRCIDMSCSECDPERPEDATFGKTAN